MHAAGPAVSGAAHPRHPAPGPGGAGRQHRQAIRHRCVSLSVLTFYLLHVHLHWGVSVVLGAAKTLPHFLLL